MTDKAKQAVDYAIADVKDNAKNKCKWDIEMNVDNESFDTIQFALALTKQVMQEGWQPIETAPKCKSSHILLNSVKWIKPWQGYWEEIEGGSGWQRFNCGGQDYLHPTHWKPLEQPSEKMIKEFMEEKS